MFAVKFLNVVVIASVFRITKSASFGEKCNSNTDCCEVAIWPTSDFSDCPLSCDDTCIGPPCEIDSDCDLDWIDVETKCSGQLCVPVSSKSKLWILGMGLFLFAVVLNNVGMQIQKLAFSKEDERVESLYMKQELENPEDYVPKPPVLLPLWWLGFTTMISGAILQLVALTFAAQSILAPLAAFNLVLNMVFAPLILKEIPSQTDIVITLVITLGCTIAVAGGDHSEKSFTPDEILDRWAEYRFLAYMCACTAGLMMGTFTAAWGRMLELDIEKPKKKATRPPPSISQKFEPKHHQHVYIHEDDDDHLDREEAEKLHLIHTSVDIDNSAMFGFGDVHVDDKVVYLKQYVVLRAYIAGHSGGNSMLFSKMALESLKADGVDALTHFAFYNFVMALIFAVLVQMYFLNSSLRMYDGLFVVPVYAAFFILFSVVNGFLFFEEYSSFSTFNWICFPLGILTTVGGVLALSVQYNPDEGAESEEQPSGSMPRGKAGKEGEIVI